MYSYRKTEEFAAKDIRRKIELLIRQYEAELDDIDGELRHPDYPPANQPYYYLKDYTLTNTEFTSLVRFLIKAYVILYARTDYNYSDNLNDFDDWKKLHLLADSVTDSLKEDKLLTVSGLVKFMLKLCPQVISAMERNYKIDREKGLVNLKAERLRETPHNLRTPMLQMHLKGKRTRSPSKKRTPAVRVNVRKMF